VDGTARVHTVSKSTNPLYYEVIREFEKLTGVPVILNTSFNIMGEPIVRTPSEAIRCFYATGMDYLVIGSFLLSK
jgi:carbamoyltransferase